MRVILKRVFFCGGNRYRSVGKSAVEIPDKFKDALPKDAVIVDEGNDPLVDGAETEGEGYVNPAHELDADRQFAEAFSETNEKAADEVDNLREKMKVVKK